MEGKIVLNPSCFEQFEEEAGIHEPQRLISISKAEFCEVINKAYAEQTLVDGYAPFCKHLFVPNFTELATSTAVITPENEHLLKSEYVARNELELPVLTRWFNQSDVPSEQAAFLDIILYSREQILAESEAMGKENSNDADYDYGVIWIKPQSVNYELPMDPITMMRNALGKEQGGSGVPLDIDSYRQSVDFWQANASINC